MNWLKQVIKQDIIGFLFLCFLVGAAFVWLGDAYGLISVNDGDKLNATVLWLTSLAIFWYAYETYQLKTSNSQQVEIQEVIMQNEFLPILEPVGLGKGAMLKSGGFSDFEIRNLGRGPAKYIDLYVNGVHVPLEWSLASGESQPMRVSAESRRQLAALIKTQPIKIRLRIIYQDIYKRKFQTENVVFDKLPRRGGYKMRQGAWDFKRIRI